MSKNMWETVKQILESKREIQELEQKIKNTKNEKIMMYYSNAIENKREEILKAKNILSNKMTAGMTVNDAIETLEKMDNELLDKNNKLGNIDNVILREKLDRSMDIVLADMLSIINCLKSTKI